MVVVDLGVGLTPEEIGRAAIDEGVDIIGLSIHAGGSVTLVTKLILALKEGGTDEIPILVGGTISKKEKERLREMGVKEIFGPGASVTSTL